MERPDPIFHFLRGYNYSCSIFYYYPAHTNSSAEYIELNALQLAWNENRITMKMSTDWQRQIGNYISNPFKPTIIIGLLPRSYTWYKGGKANDHAGDYHRQNDSQKEPAQGDAAIDEEHPPENKGYRQKYQKWQIAVCFHVNPPKLYSILCNTTGAPMRPVLQTGR